MIIANVSIDLKKIDKARIKPHANGAQYYSMDIMINDTKDQYGQDVSVTEGQTKEERLAKVKKNYLGNGKVVFKKDGESVSQPPITNAGNGMSDDNNLPF